MKNKKGFTLVELLAVIAILAILVIMALPAVLRMFNSARKDSFTNEVNTVLRTARQQYLLSGGTDTTWSNAEGSSKSLQLTGNSNLKYYIKMNDEGKITKLQVSNGDFQYNKTGIIDIASSNDVEEVTIENQLVITATGGTYKYVANTSYFYLNNSIPNNVVTYNNYQDAIDAFHHNMFFKYDISDNKIDKMVLGFIYLNNLYYLDPNMDYSDSKQYIENIFGSSTCNESTQSWGTFTRCTKNGVSCAVTSTHQVNCIINEWMCVYMDNSSHCYLTD